MFFQEDTHNSELCWIPQLSGNKPLSWSPKCSIFCYVVGILQTNCKKTTGEKIKSVIAK